ncbi:efflux RND transporter periplasmic adaptor subunit [Sunxiuqinia elliptica]|uniref:HlyD family secretion protein n=1 Tax=Sunxiuqinia elliptica TaxID=655355 RepID=A0A1I2ECJ2_9BACT|nr:efflux RND transporter periplasmic adaptor subunit [Sunxiuqinia elliptica]TDO04689.1 HlyD family secretion protein [Sunxiuqinia elliptica]TDO64237.1 HlyD family secretion protein [Sunxiuqinia elliptica]SFE90171.1 HlyD family secretion protein [Sunxiuqinia elliptica]
MKKIFKILGIALLVAIFGGTIYFLYTKSKKQPDVFETKTPFVSNVIRKTVATGSVVPRQEIEIKPQVSGIIEEVYIQPGDFVKKEQIIAKIKIIPDMVNLNAAESRLNQAKINFEDSKIDYDRQQKLFDSEVISYEDYKKAKVGYDTSKEELAAAENNLELIKNGVTKKAQTATNTLVRSTINGMVLDVPVEEGNSVIQSNTFNEGTTIASIADMQDMIFEGKVDETEVGKIKEGMPIELEIGAIEKEKFQAILEYISPKGVEENGAIQFEIKADVSLKDDQFIRAGYSANASIVLERKDSVMVIPEGMLKFENDSAFVEVLINEEENQFEKRKVETGISDGINIEVVSGLAKSDKVKGEKIDPKKLKEETDNQNT